MPPSFMFPSRTFGQRVWPPRAATVFCAGLLMVASAAPCKELTLRYQGRLQDGQQDAHGRYDVQLSVYSHAEHGALLTAPIVYPSVDVNRGRFALELDLELPEASEGWLQTAARDAGSGADFTPLPLRSKLSQATQIAQYWSTTGDAGSDPAVNFLGTTDAQPLVLRVQNQPVMRQHRARRPVQPGCRRSIHGQRLSKLCLRKLEPCSRTLRQGSWRRWIAGRMYYTRWQFRPPWQLRMERHHVIEFDQRGREPVPDSSQWWRVNQLQQPGW